jgi:hypothetical protein
MMGGDRYQIRLAIIDVDRWNDYNMYMALKGSVSQLMYTLLNLKLWQRLIFIALKGSAVNANVYVA